MGPRTHQEEPVTNAGILDANVFLRVIIGDQPHQAEPSRTLLRRINEREISGVLLPTVVLEIVFALERQYEASRDRICDALLIIFRMEPLDVVNRAPLIAGLDDYRNRPGISFADAYHCAMARAFHGGVITSFDRKLGNVPDITRIEPTES